MLIVGLGFLVQVLQPTAPTPRGVALLFATITLTFGLAALIWSAKVGVHITPDGVRNVSFSTKPTLTPWSQVDHFEYARAGVVYRIYAVTTHGSRTPMRMLAFWPYQHKLGQAYCDALNTELAGRALHQPRSA